LEISLRFDGGRIIFLGMMANFFGQKTAAGGHGTMDKLTRMLVRMTEGERGQTMAEYALIVAAVAVVVFVAYETMGTTITTLLGTVNSQL
jgi:Flp pilus assembly pilin Flp